MRTEAQAILDKQLTEAQFQSHIMELATMLGWLVYHIFDSRMCTSPGFPDLVLCHPRKGFLLAELKKETGRVSKAQEHWIAALRANGLDVRVWRPSDWQEIEETLKAI